MSIEPQELETRKLLTNIDVLGDPPDLRFDVVNESFIRGYFKNDNIGFTNHYIEVVEENGNPENWNYTDIPASGLFVIVMWEQIPVGETKVFQLTPVEVTTTPFAGQTQKGPMSEITVTGRDLNQAPEFEWVEFVVDRIGGRATDNEGDPIFVRYRKSGTENWSSQFPTTNYGHFSIVPSDIIHYGTSGSVDVQITDGKKYSEIRTIDVTMPEQPWPTTPGGDGTGTGDGGTGTGAEYGAAAYAAADEDAPATVAPVAAIPTQSDQGSGDLTDEILTIPSGPVAEVGSASLFQQDDDDLLFTDDYFGTLL